MLFLNDSSTRIYLSIGNITSTAKRYTNNAVFVSYWTAYIQLNNGVVRSITWDDDPTCSLCVSTTSCLDSTCAIPYSYVNNDCSNRRCDFLVYLAWIGTDSAGSYCTSGNSVFSRMRLFAVTPIWEAASSFAINLLTDTLNRLTV